MRRNIDSKSHLNISDLAALGCPILVSEQSKQPPTRALCVETLQKLALSQLNDREARAVAAWLVAIRDHYPSLWGYVPADVSSWATKQPLSPKLRRLALAKLGDFL